MPIAFARRRFETLKMVYWGRRNLLSPIIPACEFIEPITIFKTGRRLETLRFIKLTQYVGLNFLKVREYARLLGV